MEITIQESDGRLRNLLNLYRNVELVHPIVSSFCQVSENKEAFQKCLTHEYYLLCGRSQDLSHDDISIYQKAFVILMGKENDRIAAIEIYANELLGLRSEKPANGLQILKTAVKARGLIQNKTYGIGPSEPSLTRQHRLFSSHRGAEHQQPLREPRKSNRPQPLEEESLFLPQISDNESPRFAKVPDSTSPNDEEFFVIDTSGKAAPQPKPADLCHDPKLERLWELYLSARRDFYQEGTDCFRRTTAAKFLRDTIENCIGYIEAKNLSTLEKFPHRGPAHAKLSGPDKEKLLELRTNLQRAIKAAEKGSGGKKRHFDEDNIQTPMNAKKMMLTPSSNKSTSIQPMELEKTTPDSLFDTKSPDSKKMIHKPLVILTKKHPSNPTTNPSSPVIGPHPSDNPTSNRTQRASHPNQKRSLSPRDPGPEPGHRDRNHEDFRRSRGGYSRFAGRKLARSFPPRRVSDRYRPTY